MKTLTHFLLVSNALVFLAFGPTFLLWPSEPAKLIGIQLTSPMALADFRAMYGGLPFGVGIFFFWALVREEWVRPSLVVIASTSGMLLLSRVLSAWVDGNPGWVIWGFCSAELSSFLLATYLLKKEL